MQTIWTRRIEQTDIPLLSAWLSSTPENLADADVYSYPTIQVLHAFSNKPLAFMPAQRALVLESLAINPEASPREVAASLGELTKSTVLLAREQGIKEIYFVCKSESTCEFAKRHHFEELPYRTFRLKIDDLGKQPSCDIPTPDR